MPPDLSQPISIIKYCRPHGLINMLSKNNQLSLYHGSRLTLLKLPREPTGCASPGAAGGTQRPSPRPRPCHVCYHIVFRVLPFLLSDIPGPRPISREDAHPIVSTLSTCFSLCHDLLPTSPPISVRKAGGITVVYLCGF